MLDSQVKQMVELYYSLDIPEFDTDTSVIEVREILSRFSRSSLSATQPLSCEIKDHKVPTSFGEIKVRGYYPKNKKELAPILFFRGSGFVVDNIKDSDLFCNRLAEACHTFVLSIDYPLAPEFPFPSSLEGCYQVYLWALEHTEFVNLDSSKIVALGESSGACLLANLVQMIRDKGVKPLGYQILLYPITGADFETPSYQSFGSGYIMSKKKLSWYISQYLGSSENKNEIYAFPMNMEDLSHLPKTLILTAEFDPLCDDGSKYAQRLKGAGNLCEYINFSGMIHGFIKFSAVKRAQEGFDLLCKRIQNFQNSNEKPVSLFSPAPSSNFF